jgi:hypothetical protein
MTFDEFRQEMRKKIAEETGMPKEVLELKFSRGWSLAREVEQMRRRVLTPYLSSAFDLSEEFVEVEILKGQPNAT